jgi:hypothetical protein
MDNQYTTGKTFAMTCLESFAAEDAEKDGKQCDCEGRNAKEGNQL